MRASMPLQSHAKVLAARRHCPLPAGAFLIVYPRLRTQHGGLLLLQVRHRSRSLRRKQGLLRPLLQMHKRLQHPCLPRTRFTQFQRSLNQREARPESLQSPAMFCLLLQQRGHLRPGLRRSFANSEYPQHSTFFHGLTE